MFKVKSFKSLSSTQDEVKVYFMRTLVVAEQQTQARGQRGNKWEAPKGNLYFSFSMEATDFKRASDLCFLCGLAMANAIDSPLVKLKWPNDVFIDNAKCCGILVEQDGDRLIAGLGVNVSVPPKVKNPEYALCSLNEKGVNINAKELLNKFIKLFEDLFEKYQKDSSFIFDLWEKKALWFNEEIYLKSEPSVHGKFIGLNKKGGLILQTSTEKKVFYSGSFRKL